MENTILGLFLGLLAIVPLAIKWELPMRQVLPAAIVFGILSGLLVHVLSLYFAMSLGTRILLMPALALAIGLATLLARFYRDPERTCPQQEQCIVSPADGIVKYVKAVDNAVAPLSAKGSESVELPAELRAVIAGGSGYLVGIAMSFLDVHVTRAPIRGTVTHLEHVDGSFLSLKRPEAVHKNERLNQVIENERYAVGVIQIASRLVRRIVSYVDTGDRLVSGQRIGIIKFGSQVDILIPGTDHLDVKIRVGDRVFAGETILATYQQVAMRS